MYVERITTWHELATLESEWNALAGEIPFRSWDWLATWWKHYGSDECREGVRNVEPKNDKQLFVLAVYDDAMYPHLATASSEQPGPRPEGEGEIGKRLVGILPWYLDRNRITGNVVRWLGSGEVCTDHLSLICRAHDSERVVEAVADALTVEFDDWGHLDLVAVDLDDEPVHKLILALEERECLISRRAADSTWTIDLPSSWDSYVATLSKNNRRKIRQLQRNVLAAGRVKRHVAKNIADLEIAWPILVDLHQRRWQSLGQPGCFASRTFHEFHREVAGRLLDRGQLLISWIELDGVPAAAEYQMVDGKTAFHYQRGLNPDLLDENPGWLSAILFIGAEIEQGRKRFDLLRGNVPYKASFGATARPVYDYRVIPNRRLARLRGYVWNAADTLTDWMRMGADKVLG
jgi:CelD/BcsL family acetyltransferase involved in cellulose biosynthesis